MQYFSWIPVIFPWFRSSRMHKVIIDASITATTRVKEHMTATIGEVKRKHRTLEHKSRLSFCKSDRSPHLFPYYYFCNYRLPLLTPSAHSLLYDFHLNCSLELKASLFSCLLPVYVKEKKVRFVTTAPSEAYKLKNGRCVHSFSLTVPPRCLLSEHCLYLFTAFCLDNLSLSFTLHLPRFTRGSTWTAVVHK